VREQADNASHTQHHGSEDEVPLPLEKIEIRLFE
jgi:hypothetical protein